MEVKKLLDIGDKIPNFCLKGIDPEGKEGQPPRIWDAGLDFEQ